VQAARPCNCAVAAAGGGGGPDVRLEPAGDVGPDLEASAGAKGQLLLLLVSLLLVVAAMMLLM
jgi:hypothetical protein